MRRSAIFFILFLVGGMLLLSRPASALTTWAKKVQIFHNTDCETNNTCDLVKFELDTEDYAIIMGPFLHYGTHMRAAYETRTIDALTHYGVVQFIRGCRFRTELVGNGVQRSKLAQWQFNDTVFSHFPHWVIDSVDEDPLFPSMEGENRHALYHWGPFSHDMPRDSLKQFGDEMPSVPSLFVLDHPGLASYEEVFTYNVSLEFQTCIYKITDIPRKTTAEDTNFATPVHCFSWQSSFVFNFDLDRFETKQTLDPFCLAP